MNIRGICANMIGTIIMSTHHSSITSGIIWVLF